MTGNLLSIQPSLLNISHVQGNEPKLIKHNIQSKKINHDDNFSEMEFKFFGDDFSTSMKIKIA